MKAKTIEDLERYANVTEKPCEAISDSTVEAYTQVEAYIHEGQPGPRGGVSLADAPLIYPLRLEQIADLWLAIWFHWLEIGVEPFFNMGLFPELTMFGEIPGGEDVTYDFMETDGNGGEDGYGLHFHIAPPNSSYYTLAFTIYIVDGRLTGDVEAMNQGQRDGAYTWVESPWVMAARHLAGEYRWIKKRQSMKERHEPESDEA